MSQLPFLVVHGALVWKLLLAALVAATGLLAVRRLDLRRGLAIAAASLAGWYGVLYEIGKHLTVEAVSLAEVSSFGRVAIAAALPGSRDRALTALRNGTEAALTHDDAGLRLGLQIDAVVSRCSARRLWDAGRLEEALDAANGCAPELRARLLMQLGRYDEAAAVVDLYGEPREAMAAYLGAGRWLDAATTMSWFAASFKGESAAPARCFGQYLAIKAGELHALELLTAEPSATCKVIAQVASGEQPVAAVGDNSAAARLASVLAAAVLADQDHAIAFAIWASII